jgi:hypothetical protein
MSGLGISSLSVSHRNMKSGNDSGLSHSTLGTGRNNISVNEVPVKGSCCVCALSAKMRCSYCKIQLFCSKNCQIIDWRTHQEECAQHAFNLQASRHHFTLDDICSLCNNGILSRVYGWQLLCQDCFTALNVTYYNPEQILETPKLSEYTYMRKCQKECCYCGSTSLMVLRDEMLDEWLVCIACEKMKQLMRCWNAYMQCYVGSIERPLLKDDVNMGEDNVDINVSSTFSSFISNALCT